jgi:putative hemolysin
MSSNSSLLELGLILLFTILSGTFAMAETALISSRRARLQQRANTGEESAKQALRTFDNPNRFLATTQIVITLIGVLAGAFGGATLAEGLADVLKQIEPLAPSAEALSLFLVVLFITYLSLVIGELVPKQLALNTPEAILLAVAAPIIWLSRVVSPLVSLLNISTKFVTTMLGIKPSAEPSVTEEEIKVMLDQGTQAGTFEKTESMLVNRVFRLGDLRVDAIMTPRTDVTWLDVDDSMAEIYEKISKYPHARYPVAQGSLDNVLGIVRTKDLLLRALAPEGPTNTVFDLRALAREAPFVPDTVSVLQLLQRFKESASSLAIVIDEYGGLEGIITSTDVLQEIVGGEYFAEDWATPRATQRADGSWLLEGMMPIDELKTILGIKQLPDEDESIYQTLGGFVMSHMERIPQVGDFFEAVGYRFEVVDMDGHRIDKIWAKLSEKKAGK